MEVCKEITNKVLMPCPAEPEDQKNGREHYQLPQKRKIPRCCPIAGEKMGYPLLQMQEPQNHSKTKKYRKESK
ncbi:hypothetical protein [Candidatus Kuenenia stuttgartiensis]|uniref:hypothetical protein n=1 Tax=Kuenenia stuttgartiensis TaxID=174633 RepID=UPI00146BD607|nr:hypothetical protein [Candidatus Kuenenia stuttgartiensis]